MSHYYRPDGTPAHFEGKDGKATTLREARRLELLPSVTTILSDVIRKPALEKWMVRQALEAALTLPRLPGESDTDFAERALADSGEHSKDARDQGSAIHKAIEDGVGPHASAFQRLLDEIGWKVVWREQVLIGPDYAGRADLLCSDAIGQTILVDMKGQEWPDGKRPRHYDEWAVQLAAYAEICQADCCASFVFHRRDPERWDYKLWTKDEIDNGWHIFHNAKEIWKRQRNYFPSAKEAVA